LAALLGITGMAVPVQAEPGDGLSQTVSIPDVVAEVNGVKIGSNYVKFEFDRLMRDIRSPLTVKQQAGIVREIIDHEVVRELVFQEAKAANKRVPPETIREELGAIKTSYPSEQEFQKALKERNITEADLTRAIEIDALAGFLLEDRIKGKIDITGEEIKKYYDENKQKFMRPMSYRVRHIFVAPFPPGYLNQFPEKDRDMIKLQKSRETEEKIRSILAEIRKGANFEEMAKKYSEDSESAPNGGDLGFMYKGVFDPSFDAAVEGLKPGDVSEPFTTPYGHHIAQLIETRPPEETTFDEMKDAIQKQIFTEKAHQEAQKFMDGLRANAKIKVYF